MFTAAPFLSSYFFWTVTSQQQLFVQNSYFFRVKLLLGSYGLRISGSLGQLIFRTSYFFGGETCSEWKIRTEQPLIRIRYLEKQYSTFFRNILTGFRRATFSERLLDQNTQLSITATFLVELVFDNILFQKSYTYLPQQHFLFSN